MISTGAGQILKMKEGQGALDSIIHLGYPVYILTILGVWKVLGVVAVLTPRYPLLKEWAYAGFVFLTTGAAFSHLASDDSIISVLPALLLLVLTVVSWYFRPEDRKVNFS